MSRGNTAAFLVVGRTLNQIGALALVMVLVRLMTKTDFGLYRELLLAVTTAVVLGAFGLQPSFLYFLPRLEQDQRRPFVTQSLLLQGALSTVAGGISILLATVFVGDAHHLTPLTVTALFALPTATLVAQAIELIYIGVGRPAAAATQSIASSLLALTVGTVQAIGNASPTEVLGGQVVSRALVAGSALWVLYSGLPRTESWISPWAQAKEQLTYSFPLWLSSLTGDFNRRLDAYLVSAFWPVTVFASYEVGAREVPLVSTVSGQLANAVLPEISIASKAKDFELVRRLWHWSMQSAALIVFPSFVFLIAFAPRFISVLFTDAYTDATPVFRTYLLLLPLRLTTYGGLLSALGLTRTVLKGAVASLVVNVVMSAMLIFPLGWMGPAIATVTAQFAMILYYCIHIRAELGGTLSKLFPWREFVRTFCLSALCLIPIYAVLNKQENTLLSFGLAGAGYCAIYLTFAAALGLISVERLFSAVRARLPGRST